MFARGHFEGFEEQPHNRKACERSVHEIKRDELKSIVKKMRDMRFSDSRMLPENTSLKQVFIKDRQALNCIGVNAEDIVHRIREVINIARQTTTDEWKRVHGTDKPTDLNFKTSGAHVLIFDDIEKQPRYLKTDTVRVRNDILAKFVETTAWDGPIISEVILYYNKEWTIHRRECAKILTATQGEYAAVFEVTWGGAQICPFHPPGAEYRGYDYGCHDYVFYKVMNGSVEKFFISELSLHMIEKHGFFGGILPYRVNPIKAAKFFNIKPRPVIEKSILVDCKTGQA